MISTLSCKGSILVLSNGVGEDSISCYILKNISSSLKVIAFPLVGTGEAYISAGYRVYAPPAKLPSAGVKWNLWKRLFIDTFSGALPSLIYKQLKALRKLAEEEKLRLILAVGDIVPLIMGLLTRYWTLTEKPRMIFVGTAKSVKVEPYNLFEVKLMQMCDLCFVRDYLTADYLRERGLENCVYVGNPMLGGLKGGECLQPDIRDWIENGYPKIAILPGRYQWLEESLRIQLNAISILNRRYSNLRAVVVALPGDYYSKASEIIETYSLRNCVKVVTNRSLRAILEVADLVLGQAGTANEQAAALGKPIIAYSKTYPKLSWYRWRQVRLLGEAVRVVPPEKLAETVKFILENPKVYSEMSRAGREAMGTENGAKNIGQRINRLLEEVCRD